MADQPANIVESQIPTNIQVEGDNLLIDIDEINLLKIADLSNWTEMSMEEVYNNNPEILDSIYQQDDFNESFYITREFGQLIYKEYELTLSTGENVKLKVAITTGLDKKGNIYTLDSETVKRFINKVDTDIIPSAGKVIDILSNSRSPIQSEYLIVLKNVSIGDMAQSALNSADIDSNSNTYEMVRKKFLGIGYFQKLGKTKTDTFNYETLKNNLLEEGLSLDEITEFVPLFKEFMSEHSLLHTRISNRIFHIYRYLENNTDLQRTDIENFLRVFLSDGVMNLENLNLPFSPDFYTPDMLNLQDNRIHHMTVNNVRQKNSKKDFTNKYLDLIVKIVMDQRYYSAIVNAIKDNPSYKKYIDSENVFAYSYGNVVEISGDIFKSGINANALLEELVHALSKPSFSFPIELSSEDSTDQLSRISKETLDTNKEIRSIHEEMYTHIILIELIESGLLEGTIFGSLSQPWPSQIYSLNNNPFDGYRASVPMYIILMRGWVEDGLDETFLDYIIREKANSERFIEKIFNQIPLATEGEEGKLIVGYLNSLMENNPYWLYQDQFELAGGSSYHVIASAYESLKQILDTDYKLYRQISSMPLISDVLFTPETLRDIQSLVSDSNHLSITEKINDIAYVGASTYHIEIELPLVNNQPDSITKIEGKAVVLDSNNAIVEIIDLNLENSFIFDQNQIFTIGKINNKKWSRVLIITPNEIKSSEININSYAG